VALQSAVSATYNGDTFSHQACHMNDAYLDSVTGQHVKKDGTKAGMMQAIITNTL
jgi:endoglucanase